MADRVFAAVAVLQLGDALVDVAAGLAGAVRAGDEALRERQLELDLEEEALVGFPVLGERALVDEEQRERPGAAVEALARRVAELADQDDAGGALDGEAGLQAGGLERDRDGDRAAGRSWRRRACRRSRVSYADGASAATGGINKVRGIAQDTNRSIRTSSTATNSRGSSTIEARAGSEMNLSGPFDGSDRLVHRSDE